MHNVPPIRRLVEADIPNPHILAPNKPYQSRPALVAQTRAGLVPAHHHILPLVESLDKLQALAVDLPAAGDAHIRHILRHHHVPSVLLLGVVLQPTPAEDSGVSRYVQYDARFEVQSGGEVVPGGEVDLAGALVERGGGGAVIYGGLDGDRVVLVAGGRGTVI